MFRPSARIALFAVGLASAAAGACAQTSREASPPGIVVAPVSQGTALAVEPALADASPEGATSVEGDRSAVVDAGGAPARFRACQTDSECVAAPRVGCCHNGWNEAVAASEKDAYEASFVCPEAHPMCAMFIVRDTRQPRCDGATHLCTLVAK